jgi:hypothetical protein
MPEQKDLNLTWKAHHPVDDFSTWTSQSKRNESTNFKIKYLGMAQNYQLTTFLKASGEQATFHADWNEAVRYANRWDLSYFNTMRRDQKKEPDNMPFEECYITTDVAEETPLQEAARLAQTIKDLAAELKKVGGSPKKNEQLAKNMLRTNDPNAPCDILEEIIVLDDILYNLSLTFHKINQQPSPPPEIAEEEAIIITDNW